MNSKEKFLHSIGLLNRSDVDKHRKDTGLSIQYEPPNTSNDLLLTLSKLGISSDNQLQVEQRLRQFSPHVVLNCSKLESSPIKSSPIKRSPIKSSPIKVSKLDVHAESTICQNSILRLSCVKDDNSKSGVLPSMETRSTMCIDLCSEVGRKLRSQVKKQLRKHRYSERNHVTAGQGSEVWYDAYCGGSNPIVTDSHIETRRSAGAEFIMAYNPGKNSTGFVHEYRYTRRQRREFCRHLDTGLNARSRRLRNRMKPCRLMLHRLSLKTIEHWAELSRKKAESHRKLKVENCSVSLVNLLGDCMFCGKNCTCIKSTEDECETPVDENSLIRPIQSRHHVFNKTQPVSCSVSLCKSHVCDSLCIKAHLMAYSDSSTSCASLSDVSTYQEFSLYDDASFIDPVSSNRIPIRPCHVELKKCDMKWMHSQSQHKVVSSVDMSSTQFTASPSLAENEISKHLIVKCERISSIDWLQQDVKDSDLGNALESKFCRELKYTAAHSSPESNKSDDLYTLPLTPQSFSECQVF